MTNALIIKPYFKEGDFKNLHKMDYNFLRDYVRFRKWHGFPTLLTSDYRDSATSTHGKGLALDAILFEDFGRKQPHWFEIYASALQFGFKGVGIYTDWNYKGRNWVGLHVDNGREHPLTWVQHGGAYYYKRNGVFIDGEGRQLTINQIDEICNNIQL